MKMEAIKFTSSGETLSGNLFLPENLDKPVPAVTILGPMTFVKEQAPTEYAKRFAQHGFASLVFDPRYHGESTGAERRWEHPLAKIADVKASLDYLSQREGIDATQLIGMAVCQGSSEMVRAAANDTRIKVVSTVAGHYRDYIGDLEWLGEESRESRLAKGWEAKTKYLQHGEIDYVPAVDPERTDVGMPGEFVWNWYSAWAQKGIWENRYAVMSDADLLTYESLSAMTQLDKPYLMIHSDNSFLPNTAKRHFDTVKSTEKQLLWEGETAHFQYYDDPNVLDATVVEMVEFFRTHLS
ncbi:MAG: alpha/beta hydrolase [Deinococcota bacterium]